MAILPLADRDVAVIDSYRPHTDNTSPLVTQADTPGEDLQRMAVTSRPELPDPTVGGETASRIRNGFSNGFKSLFNRQQPFSGAVAKPPAITNAVQGEVGATNRASRLYAGVMNQQVQYTASQAAYSAAWVGATAPLEKAAK